jgi:hypothetical protein
MQANVFMPAMQFSYAPWDYDAEVNLITVEYKIVFQNMMESFVYFIHVCMQVVAMAHQMTALHYQYAPLIISLCNKNDNIL